MTAPDAECGDGKCSCGISRLGSLRDELRRHDRSGTSRELDLSRNSGKALAAAAPAAASAICSARRTSRCRLGRASRACLDRSMTVTMDVVMPDIARGNADACSGYWTLGGPQNSGGRHKRNDAALCGDWQRCSTPISANRLAISIRFCTPGPSYVFRDISDGLSNSSRRCDGLQFGTRLGCLHRSRCRERRLR